MPYVKAPHRSVDLADGERLRDGNLASANVANTWSVAVWARPSGDFSSNRALFSIEHELTLAFPINFPFSNIRIFFNVGGGFNNMVVQTWAGFAAPIKNYTWLGWWTQNTWLHTTITWDGTSLLAYRNGVAVAPSIITTDAAGSMGNPPARWIGVGCFASTGLAADAFRGRIHSAALWNVAISSSAVAEIYNGGYGAKFDLLTNRGNYTSAANLQHYWRAGHFYPPTIGIGRDYGVATSNQRNVMNSAVGVDETDLVHDYPGREL